MVMNSDARVAINERGLIGGTDSPACDTCDYPKDQTYQDPFYFNNDGPQSLQNPPNIKQTVTYDPDSNIYVLTQTVGGLQYRPPMYMTFEEYLYYDVQKSVDEYWKQRVSAESAAQGHSSKGLIPPIKINSEKFDRIFGGGTIDIRPQGSAELIFGVNVNRTDNPALPERQRRIATFEFDEKIQLNVVGKIGEKLKLTTNYNTESTFEFENQMKLEYTGFEDEIIKKIEAGNVTFGLNSSLITGSQTLFGIKTEFQFGRLTMTNILSQQRGKKSEVNVTGGAQVTNYEVNGDNYEANKHFFLSQYFFNNYDQSMANLPVINSGVQITRVEVWVTNRTGVVDNTRNIVAFTDLGEDSLENVGSGFITVDQTQAPYPDNQRNDLYEQLIDDYTDPNGLSLRDISDPIQQTFATLQQGFGFSQSVNYERLNNARKLLPTEFTINERLGFISLNQALNYDEVVACSFQYTLNGQVYQVGEFSTDGIGGQEALIVKLLKSTNNVPKVASGVPYRTWDLMMKNIYSIGAYQINPQDFVLQVWYNNPSTGTDIPFIPEGPISSVPLIQVMGLDKLNQQLQPSPDGLFDFIDRITVYANNGRIIFPVTQPFGEYLEDKLGGPSPLANKYVYKELYDSTKTVASTTFAGKNRFKLKGSYKSSSNSDISLNAVNIPAGSVTVTAGGAPLQENVDYTVDYTLGRVRIINESVLNSGVPIKISLESNSLFNIQSKTLWGTHLNYRVNRDFNVGATVMNLTERPITQKINIGDEPMSNTIWGFDVNYRTDAPFLTRMVDRLPLISTKAPSSITAQGEFAYLVPGHNKAIGKNGNSYIDDFEGTQSAIDIRSPQSWSLASVPQLQPTRWPEAGADSLWSGANRAKFAWYVIDPLFLRPDNNLKPDHISLADQSDHRVREVLETEVFPNKQPPSGQPMNISMLDIAYYPSERGPYNFDVMPSPYTAGLDPSGNGLLADPASRWGGMQRRIETNDFEAANIEYIQFWMMDPYNEDVAPSQQNTAGELFIHLGNISEDVLKDSRNSFENGMPANGDFSLIDTTEWGRVPVVQSIVNAFDNDEAARPLQDVGLDGLGDNDEQSFFNDYLEGIATNYPNSTAYSNAVKDPAADNYHYYRGSDYDAQAKPVLERYKMFNGPDGNSPANGQPNDDGYSEDYPTQSTTLPNQEDINRDNTLNETEGYYEYRVKLDPTNINRNNVGNNYITDVYVTNVTTKDGRSREIVWYQFRVPVRQYDAKVGNIENFNSIRFIRLGIRGADKPVVCRFARLEFIRSDWRKYQFSLLYPGEYISNDQSNTEFQVAAINIEENGNRTPINYVLPPGIDREQNVQSATLVRLNEQSLSMKVCDLEDGDSRAAFKTVNNMDVRSYKKIRMFVHAEQRAGSNQPLNNGDVSAFIRIGSDYTDNYYEYEIPLNVTPAGTYSANDQVDREKVWPEANNMELAFELLQYVKQQRNIAISNGTATLTSEFTIADPDHPERKITVKGNPNLAMIKIFMLGIRNPKMTSANSGSDDGLSKCAEVWFNELRLTDFNEDGGWAATTRVTAKLADFGTINISGNMATPGFGSIEKKVSDRLREKQVNYDVSTQLELGRFFPEKAGIRLPLFWGYGETFITPQFNPLDPDILLAPVLSNEDLGDNARDSIRGATVDYTRRKSLNFTNVHKEKAKGGKAHIYDISNFTLSYAYTELYRHNVNIEYSSTKNHRGGITWSYQPNAKPWKPFEKKKWAKGKWMTIPREFQLAYMPASIGVTMDLNRTYSEVKQRNITGYNDVFTPVNFNKNFVWNRNYDLRWDLTKNLKFDFSADNQAQVLEPYGKIDTPEKKDTLVDNIRGFGTTMTYHHQSNVTYTVPINKIPAFDWLSGNVRYQTGYTWTRGPLAADSIGNAVGNNAQWQFTGQANMVTLYNKIPYFKKVNNKKIGVKPPTKPDAPKDSTKKDNDQYVILEYLARAVMTVRTVSVNYSNNSTMALPGYKPKTSLLGFDERFEAPGLGFLFGKQNHFGPDKNQDFPLYAKSNGWLVQESSIYTPFTRGNTQNFTGRAALEPFPDLKIELTANKTTSLNRTEFFRWNDISQMFERQSTTETGSYSVSIITWSTAFKKETGDDHTSEVFEQFLNNRAVISQRLGAENPYSTGINDTTGYARGYSKTSQEVLIPAFIAAYTGKNAGNTATTAFPKMPLPNWRIQYDGLTKFAKVRKRFKTVSLGHTYRSTYSVSGFLTNLNYREQPNGFTEVRNVSNDFESKYQIGTVQISEQFSPMISIDVVWAGKRNFSTKFEFKKDRTLSLSLANTQITEVSGKEYVVGMGYRIPQLELKFFDKFMGGKIKPPKSDLDLRADISFRNNQTVIRKSVEEINVLTAGQNILSIKTSAQYQMTDKLIIRFFCDRVMTNPLVSSSFKTANTNAGLSLRFLLQ